MVRAYRGIIKEKEALEASFKVLSEMGRGEEGEETEEERGEGEGVDSGVEKSSESGEREGEKEGGEEGGRQSEAESSEKETVVPEKKVGSLLCVCVCVIQISQSLCSSCIVQHCLQLSFNSQLYNNNSSLVFQVIHLYITLYVVHNMHCYCIA